MDHLSPVVNTGNWSFGNWRPRVARADSERYDWCRHYSDRQSDWCGKGEEPISWERITWRAAVIGRWTGLLLGTLIALVFLTLVAGEGPPPLVHLPFREALILAAMTTLFAGLVLAWKWEGLGGVVTLVGYGMLLRELVEQRPVDSMLTLAGGLGLVHVLCWWRIRKGEPAGGVKWAIPKWISWPSIAIAGTFLLLCINEVFFNPPYMTPPLHPGEAMQGLWQARVRPVAAKPTVKAIDIQLTIHEDASVTGRMGDATVVSGKIQNNRSWFGWWMHWRDEYAMQGELSKAIAVGNQPADDHFRVVLRRRGANLAGALFLAKRPVGLTLEKQ